MLKNSWLKMFGLTQQISLLLNEEICLVVPEIQKSLTMALVYFWKNVCLGES